jgi:hypothetical protein
MLRGWTHCGGYRPEYRQTLTVVANITQILTAGGKVTLDYVCRTFFQKKTKFHHTFLHTPILFVKKSGKMMISNSYNSTALRDDFTTQWTIKRSKQ